MLDKATLVIRETGPSKSDHSHDAWEPEFTDNRFTAQLVCSNPDCKNVVVVCGKSTIERDYGYDHEGNTEVDYTDHFSPTHFFEAPPVFPIAQECPPEVGTQLKAAFSLIWIDTGAAANRLRSAAEALLTDKGIVKSARNKAGKRYRLSLHDRIEKFQQDHKEPATYLLAIKWLGNEGSHRGLDELSVDDLLGAFELFEHVIDAVYVKRADRMRRLAAEINKRKGSIRKRRRKYDPANPFG